MPVICILAVTAKCRDLGHHTAGHHTDGPMFYAGRNRFISGKQSQYLVWLCICCYIIIFWRKPQQRVTHTAANYIGLVAAVLEPAQHRCGIIGNIH
jgi:hypothetical protein